jgi:hypothetical protein
MKDQNAPKAVTRTRVILVISLVLNLALVFAALKLRQYPSFSLLSYPVTVGAKTVAGPQSNDALPAAVTYLTNQFRWRMIEFTNYEQFAANLRGIGCPEKTVRTIVRGDVNRHYDELFRQSKTNLPFWTGGRKWQAALTAQHARQAALEKERGVLLGRVLGIEDYPFPSSPWVDELTELAVVRFLAGPMQEESFQKLVTIAGKNRILRCEFDERTKHLLTEADKAEAKNLGESMMREIQAQLSATQWEEFRARMGATALTGFLISKSDNFFESAGLTTSEYRQISAACRVFGYEHEFFDWEIDATDSEKEQRLSQFTNEVAQILGENRFADFQRALDLDFGELFRLAQSYQLSREAAVQVYEMRQLAAQEVERIRNDGAMDEAARDQNFAEMQADLQKAVSRILGTEAYLSYLTQGGEWITNLSQLNL